ASGTSAHARRLVHFARFRRFPPGDLAPPSTSAAHSLGSTNANGGTSAELAPGANAGVAVRSNGRAAGIRVFLDPFTRHFYGNQLFDPATRFNRDGALLPWIRLKERLTARGV